MPRTARHRRPQARRKEHPGPQAAREWADGQLLRVLHSRAQPVAATLKSVAAKTRAKPRTRQLDLTDVDKAVTYLTTTTSTCGTTRRSPPAGRSPPA